jgi:hypothetical protein
MPTAIVVSKMFWLNAAASDMKIDQSQNKK